MVGDGLIGRIDGADDAAGVRVERGPVGPVVRPPEASDTVLLYLPGAGPAADYEATVSAARHLAVRTRATVVAPEYQATFPAALDDVHAGYEYCRDAGSVVVVGARLGGALAASLLVRLRDSGAEEPQCAVLVGALLDLTLEARSLLRNASGDAEFDVASLKQRVDAYAGGTVRTDSLLSPLYANLYGLPPLQLLVAGTDPLLDDSLAFAARAARSHVTVDLRVPQDVASLRAHAGAIMAEFIAAALPTARAASRSGHP